MNSYCNKSTVHSVQACTKGLNDENWPLPLWFDLDNVKVGFFNKLYYRKQYNSWQKGVKFNGLKEFDFFWVPVLNKMFFKRTFDESLLEAFDANSKYAFNKLFTNPILHSKKEILESIKQNYKRRDWVASISTIFPLIDFVVRRILKTTNLGIDVSKICKLFEQNGFSIENAEHLMPNAAFVSSFQLGKPYFSEERNEWFNKMLEHDFGLIGPALSSFVKFSNIYYSYYKEDQQTEQITQLNRHAILHGSISQFGTKVNTVKLLTFLYLILELEFVFEILFKEQ